MLKIFNNFELHKFINIVTYMLHMEQKDYRYEILLKLIGNSFHVRGLSKELEINHMLVVRRLKEFHESNVVDFKQEGKNKIYFLKKTSEAKQSVFMAENYKLIRVLKEYPLLRSIVEKVQENSQIKLCILFGSYAKFRANKNSDIDIYIETEDRQLKKEIELINPHLDVKIGKYNKDNLLIKEIEKYHVIIKGIEIFYEKSNIM